MYLLKALFGKRNSSADELLLKVLESGLYELQTILGILSSGESARCYTRSRSLFEVGYDGYTPLHWACSSVYSPDEIEVVKLLLSRGANVNVASKYGHAPLHMAATNNASWRSTPANPALIGVLVRAGANVSATNSSGHTPLHNAANFGYFEAAKRLIEGGADVNAQKCRKGICDGYTPLHSAVSAVGDHRGKLRTIDLLISRGANREAKTNLGPVGETALDRAKGLLALTCARGDATLDEITQRREIISRLDVAT